MTAEAGQPGFEGLTEEQLCALGCAVAACAQLEVLAMTALASFLKVPQPTAQAICGDQPHSWVFERLQRLTPIFVADEALQERWRSWIQSLSNINQRRNGVVHTTWVTDPASLKMQGIRPHKTGMLPQSSSLEELKALIDDATDVSGDFFELLLETPGMLA